ncbi:MAG: hypothetical protein H7Y16_00790 [Candidatus Parcubacteria bacterium]|nr:hypothetical protein [Burkholderiales bacterium]
MSNYERYSHLRIDRPHPHLLRITLSSPLKINAMDSVMHSECFGPEWQEGRAAFQQKRPPRFVPESQA